MLDSLSHAILSILLGLYQVLGNLGLSIVSFTVIIRSLLLPLSFNSMKSQKKIKELQPQLQKELKALESQKGISKEELQKAKLAVYQKYNVNPLSGCLPQLVQLGLLIVLYQALIGFLKNPEINGQVVNTQFAWVDLTKPDPLFILPILAGVTQLILSVMLLPGGETADVAPNKSNKKAIQEINKKEEDMASMASSMQKQMLFMMPAMTTFIAFKFPAGVALYWVSTTLFSIAQQWFVTGPGGITLYAKRLVSLFKRK